MFLVNLVDLNDLKNYGILLCNNDLINKENIQERIYEIKEDMEKNEIEWVVEDIIKKLPAIWEITLYKGEKIYI